MTKEEIEMRLSEVESQLTTAFDELVTHCGDFRRYTKEIKIYTDKLQKEDEIIKQCRAKLDLLTEEKTRLIMDRPAERAMAAMLESEGQL